MYMKVYSIHQELNLNVFVYLFRLTSGTAEPILTGLSLGDSYDIRSNIG